MTASSWSREWVGGVAMVSHMGSSSRVVGPKVGSSRWSAIRRSTRCGTHPRRDLAAGAEAELGQDVLDVVLGGAFGDHEPLRDLAVGQAVGDEAGDLVLAAAQLRHGEGGHAERADRAVGGALHGVGVL